MRTWLRSKVRLLFMTCAVLLAIPAIALADNITNNLDASVDSTAEVMTLQVGATSGNTTQLSVIPTGSGPTPADGKSGCNITGSTSVTFPVSSSNPAVATVNPNSVTFTSCGVIRTLTVTPLAQGSTTISLGAPTSNNTGGTFDTAPATFTVNVTPPPSSNTPPQVSVQGVTEGAFYEKGSVPSATCQVTDVEDGNSSFAATINSSQLNQYGLGQQTASCSYTDNGGLSASSSKTYSIQDTTPPSIAPHENVSANAANAQGAVVNYTNPTANDAVYGPVAVDCLPASGSTFPLGDTTVTCTATDGSGNTATSTFTVTVSDATPPVITHEIQGTLGNDGWYTSAVDLTWSVTDPESPNSISKTGCADQHITSDQGPTTYSCSATSAGGSAGPETVTIKRDGTPPNVTLGGVSGTAGNNDWYTSVVTQTFNATDATSGLVGPASFTRDSGANEEGQNVNIPSGPVSDNAGNTASASAGPFKVDLSDPEANCDDAPTGWSQNDVNIHCQASDAVSGLANTGDASFDLSTSVPNGTETANASTDERVIADAAGRTVTAGPISGIKVDKKAPVLTDEGPTTTPDGDNGWYKSAVTNGFKATDGGSGFAPSGDLTKSFTKSSGTNEGDAVTIASDAVSDAVGNSADSIDSAAFKIDLSNPTNVTFVGGPNAGEHFFGETPDKPTCTADDAVSGFASCEVTGYSTAVGSHTMTATAKDNAGRTATATRQYTVKAWTTKGFYQPVDMNGVYNTVKGGSTVPLKFELFAGSELTDTASIKSLQSQKITCSGTAVEDAIEATATGSTSLRYDSTGGQFIYNWKTPAGAGSCHKVTLTAQDGSTIIAFFKMK